MTTYLLEFPAPTGWISANQRQHWTKRAAATRVWRDAAHLWAKKNKLPKGLQRVQIDATLSFAVNRQRDIANYAPTIKACVDGIVTDYGLLPGDHDEHLVGPFLHPGTKECKAYGWVELKIRELP